MALSALKDTDNPADNLYSVFEQKLIAALGQYISAGNGQNTLYYFYSDFEKAVAQANDDTIRLKAAVVIPQLEDTHVLPAEIKMNNITTLLLEAALFGHFPRKTKGEMYKNAAFEILFLHNIGKSKQTPLRQLIGKSTSGFAKHLPKMMEYGLIKELPSKYYALTDKSIHILLKLFGVIKTEQS